MNTETLFGRMATIEYRCEEARLIHQGIRHERRLSPGSPSAGEQPIITVTVGPDTTIGELSCHIAEPSRDVVPLQLVKTEWNLLLWGYNEIWQAELPAWPRGTLVRYRIQARTALSDETHWIDDGADYSYIVGDSGPPDWALPATIYQIFPDRFSPGKGRPWNKAKNLSDIYGGTLQGIIDHLDYISEMGFTTLWLNPFFPDETHHGYHATDYFAVNPRLGTMDDMRMLIKLSHERGLRLLLDFVGNHWGSKHATFQAAQADRYSPFHSWYYWKRWPDEYVAYYDVSDLPKLNVGNPAVREHMKDSIRFWLGEIGFDGLRLDHAHGPTFDFWADMRMAARDTRPDAWMFGEVTQPPDQQLRYAGLLDGTLDFLLCQALRDTFAHRSMSIAAFDALLNRHEAYYPDQSAFSRPSFIDNHDMDRFLFRANGDKRRLKLAALVQFTLGGAPIIYNGTEVGVSQERAIYDRSSQGMAECRQPMRWGADQDGDLASYIRRLIHLRRGHPSLWRGRRRTLHLDPVAGTYAYVREYGDEAVIVGLNLSDEPRNFLADQGDNGTIVAFELPAMNGDVITI